jgi:multidrug transporter EmrE-like cation transporter
MNAKMLVAAIAVNLVLSALAGTAARTWAGTSAAGWLVAAIACNVVAFVALAFAIRAAGLGMGTAIALLASVTLNVLIGTCVFHEVLRPMQIAGIGAALVAISLMTFG